MQATATLDSEELLADLTPENPKVLYGVNWEDYSELTENLLEETQFLNRSQREDRFEVLLDFEEWLQENK